MFKNTKRATRRHHQNRLKKNRRNYWGYGKHGWRAYCEHERGSLYEMPNNYVGMVLQHPCVCSCSMCGNPRRHGGWAGERITMQERRADDDFKDQMDDWFFDPTSAE